MLTDQVDVKPSQSAYHQYPYPPTLLQVPLRDTVLAAGFIQDQASYSNNLLCCKFTNKCVLAFNLFIYSSFMLCLCMSWPWLLTMYKHRLQYLWQTFWMTGEQ